MLTPTVMSQHQRELVSVAKQDSCWTPRLTVGCLTHVLPTTLMESVLAVLLVTNLTQTQETAHLSIANIWTT